MTTNYIVEGDKSVLNQGNYYPISEEPDNMIERLRQIIEYDVCYKGKLIWTDCQIPEHEDVSPEICDCLDNDS